MKWFVCFVLLLAVAGSPAAEIDEQVDVGIMEVWVKVMDRKGNVVRDLTANDFQLYIDDNQVDLRCFDKTFRQSSESLDESPGHKYIFFFDMYNTLPGDMDSLKNHVRRFILNSFGNKDQAMVFAMLPNAHLGVVQPMTSDRNALISVIRKMRGNVSLATTAERNEKELLYLLYPADTTRDDNPASKRGVGPRPMDTLHTAQTMARNFAAQEESRTRFTLNSFVSIGEHLASESLTGGGVALIYVSGGFPVRPGEHYFDLVYRIIEQRLTAGNPDLAMTDRPRFDFQQDLRRTIGQLNRMNITIYALDAKGLVLNARGADRNSIQAAHGMDLLSRDHQLQDSLVHIAQETGGLAFINGQNYQQGLAEIVRDMNEQYLLCGSLHPSEKKGKYHEIKVKVLRPGLRVRHRKGYVD